MPLVFLAGAALLTVFSVRYLSGARFTPPPPLSQAQESTIEEAPAPRLVAEAVPIEFGDTLDELLADAGMDIETRLAMLDAFDGAYSVRKVRAGRDITLERWTDTGEIESMEYVIDPDHRVLVHRDQTGIVGEVLDIPGTVEVASVCATLEDSMYMAMNRAGERDELTMRLIDIFAYDVDFYRDPRVGDQFCALVEKKFYSNDQPYTYQRILAAKYTNSGTTYDAFLFQPEGTEKAAYYTSEGRSVQSAFLRMPVAFNARVSSHFSSSRLHPVLGVRRAHLGTDYAAPTGTPILAVASGRVVQSSSSSGNGNFVTLEHANGYRTMYLHMSKRLVKVGQRVEQGHHIGLVGMTGLASGPHLDIRISQNGKWLDWEKLRAPRTVTLNSEEMAAFASVRDQLWQRMNSPQPRELLTQTAEPSVSGTAAGQ